mgnify:CR=1 FL=1
MEEKKVNWGVIGIIVAILILAGAIFFTGIKIDATVKIVREQLKKELTDYIRKEAISFIYAYRNCAVEDRQITEDDILKGRKFAEELIAKLP